MFTFFTIRKKKKTSFISSFTTNTKISFEKPQLKEEPFYFSIIKFSSFENFSYGFIFLKYF